MLEYPIIMWVQVHVPVGGGRRLTRSPDTHSHMHIHTYIHTHTYAHTHAHACMDAHGIMRLDLMIFLLPQVLRRMVGGGTELIVHVSPKVYEACTVQGYQVKWP